MEGIVFTGFLEMVEEKYGYEAVDQIIEEGNLPSGGTCTSVGTYSHAEMVQLITRLSIKTDKDAPSLLKAFALYFFDTLEKSYPQFLERADDKKYKKSQSKYAHCGINRLRLSLQKR